jgi:glutamate-1-semialdehyde 2,1-aminomutase
MTRGSGSRITDADGNEYLDLMMGYGSLVHGHAHPAIVDAITKTAAGGTMFATADTLEVEVAERLVAITPGADQIRFTNTGTETVMAAIRLARGVTGRQAILKFEGHYHGWYDAVLLNSHPALPHQLGDPRDPIRICDSSGITQGAIGDTCLAPWGDLERIEELLRSRLFAAVISEPIMANIGVIPPAQGFLSGLAGLCRDTGTLLILDETVTGFRLRPGGAQELYGVDADLVTFGKALGAGLPVAALAGRADIMDGLRSGRVLHYGTHNASHLGLAVVNASLDLLLDNEGAAFDQMTRRGDRLAAGLAAALQTANVPAIVQNVGQMIQAFMLTRDAADRDITQIRDFRDFCQYCDVPKFRHFAHLMIEEGVYMSPSASLHSIVTTQTSDADIDFAIATAATVARKLSAEPRGDF